MSEEFETRSRSGAAGGARDSRILTVGELSGVIRGLLEEAFPTVRVLGEVTNLSRPQSGHLYFSLVDGENGSASRFTTPQLPCVVWRSTVSRLRAPPENGQKVVVSGRLTVYEPRGTYQLVATRVEAFGLGELQVLFDELKAKLRAEGLFESERKRPLPFLPRRIALVTSPTGAAVQDALRSIYRRLPTAWVRIVPVRVQGEGSAEEIVRALTFLQSGGGQADVVVLARGGGSLEDLWSFNDERVARAVAACSIPTVSAVGHEVDFTIADFVADARAQTPTQAGELVVPDATALRDGLRDARSRLGFALRRRLERAGTELDRLRRRRPFEVPETFIQPLFERCDVVSEALRFHLYNRRRQWDDSLAAISGRMEALNPLKVLARGYSVTRDSEGRVVQDADVLQRGQELQIILARGRVRASVLELERADTVQRGGARSG